MSIPTLALVLLCMQDFDAIVNGSYLNNWGTVYQSEFELAQADADFST
jgi:hypothetical protein